MAEYNHPLKLHARVMAFSEENPALAWRPAVINKVDEYDNNLPYRVTWDDPNTSDGVESWVHHHHIREEATPLADVWEYRYKRHSSHQWTEWVAIEERAFILNFITGKVEFRKRPKRTADEIVAKLRELSADVPAADIDSTYRRILNGDF